MADFNQVAEQFVKFYYDTFDTNRQGLSALYRDSSMLTFENAPFMGVANITEKLTSLPFQKVQHLVTTIDAQPTMQDGAIAVMVSGALKVDEQPQPMSYVQIFTLVKEGDNYYVLNDMFRLIYPAA